MPFSLSTKSSCHWKYHFLANRPTLANKIDRWAWEVKGRFWETAPTRTARLPQTPGMPGRYRPHPPGIGRPHTPFAVAPVKTASMPCSAVSSRRTASALAAAGTRGVDGVPGHARRPLAADVHAGVGGGEGGSAVVLGGCGGCVGCGGVEAPLVLWLQWCRGGGRWGRIRWCWQNWRR